MSYPNVFLIILDTLREDYAYPILKELGKKGFVIYNNVISPSPWTTPSHASMVTGLYPAFHKAHETRKIKDINIKLKDQTFSFIRALSEKGYKRYLLSSNIYVSPYFGFKNFDIYIDTTAPKFLDEKEKKLLYQMKITKNDINNKDIFKIFLKGGSWKLLGKLIIGYTHKKIKWPKDKGSTNTLFYLEKTLQDNPKNAPLFVMFNFMEMHEPYKRNENIYEIRAKNRLGHSPPKRVVENWRKKYPTEARYLKKKLLKLIETISEYDLFENSLIIVTSDHGQMVGENGIVGHGTYLYDELLRVPLAIKYPQTREVVVNEHDNINYINLIKIKPLILQAVNNSKIDDSLLYSPIVFAESYGIPERVKPTTTEEMNYVNYLEKYRIAIYYGGEKYIFNVNDWKFENSQTPNREIKKQLMKFIDASHLSGASKTELNSYKVA